MKSKLTWNFWRRRAGLHFFWFAGSDRYNPILLRVTLNAHRRAALALDELANLCFPVYFIVGPLLEP